MPLKTNYHTHTVLCGHATGSINDIINAAIEYGYKELGFSEHAPLPMHLFNEYDSKRLYAYENMSMDTFHKDYLNVLKKESERKDISIKIGLESEYIEGEEEFYKELRSNVEYMILGVHFFMYKGKLIDTYAEINKDTMYAYANNIEKALSTGLFDYLAHPDLFLYNDIEFDSDAIKVSNMIIDSCIRHNVILEINCNGKGKYPRREFYELVKNKPVKVMIGVDAHDPLRLKGVHIEDSINLSNMLGIKIVDKLEV
ncbi:MAG: PHP domain-containing protein [Anaeroplasmataceae bacterium]